MGDSHRTHRYNAEYDRPARTRSAHKSLAGQLLLAAPCYLHYGMDDLDTIKLILSHLKLIIRLECPYGSCDLHIFHMADARC
jgi:hypothetical protein